MKRSWFSKLLMLGCCALLWACSGASTPGGAAGPSGGPVGGSGGVSSPVEGAGAVGAAQPMDTGFAGPVSDVDSLKYFLRDATATVLCVAGDGLVKVRFQGYLISELPSEIYSATGPIRVNDVSGGHYQVSLTSMDADKFGMLNTTMEVRSDLNVKFGYQPSYSGPLDTLLPTPNQGYLLNLPVELKPELKVEQGPASQQPCIEMKKTFNFSEEDAPAPVLELSH